MRIKLAIAVSLYFVLGFAIPSFAGVDEWQSLIQEGSRCKFDGRYDAALKIFSSALKLAEDQKLPAKCLPITLCRVADVNVITNKIDDADKLISRIVELLKKQREDHNLDPQVSFWAAVLSDSYLGNTRPDNRERCLKRACYLKEVIYGDSHHECLGCLSKLADYYIEQNQLDKALRIYSLAQKIAEKKFGQNPDALGNTLHNIALKSRKAHKYDQAKNLELEVIKLARNGKGYLKDGLPAFYCFLAMNELAQGNVNQGKKYFAEAKQEAGLGDRVSRLAHCRQFFESLIDPIVADIEQTRYDLAENELNWLINLKKTMYGGGADLYQPYSRLAALLNVQHRWQDTISYLIPCIKIAEKNDSAFHKELPDLYLRLGMAELLSGETEKSQHSFENALDAEKDKKGFHTADVYLFWGWRLIATGKMNDGVQKVNQALKIARALPATQRGTIVIDSNRILSKIYSVQGRVEEANTAKQDFVNELKIQQKIANHLGPGLYFHHEI